ncbi:MAG: Ig-like domain-containing protein [Clostridia bacterium]|nr:Ig-like domain-containing protein [Clostridia bacterium]
MKRKISVLCIALAILLMSFSTAFASGLEIVKTSPEDGSSGFQPKNMAVKFTFSENMMDEAAIAANKDKFTIKDPEGAAQPFDLVYNAEKYPNELWLVLENELGSNTEYTVTVLPGVKSASGSTLSEGMDFMFKTRNLSTDGKISMGLMMVMMFVMFGATSKAAKKAQEEADPKAAIKTAETAANLNPYKIAKERNISLDEAKAIVAKEKEKLDKKKAKEEETRIRKEEKRAAQIKAIEEELEEDSSYLDAVLREEGIYRVAGPKSVKAAGGRIPRSVRQKKEARRKAEAAKAKKAMQNKKKK